jgi:hypothetical protein
MLWPLLLRALLVSLFSGGWALGTGGPGGGQGIPRGVVEGPGLEVGEGDWAVRLTPGRWQLEAFGDLNSLLPETPRFVPTETKSLPVLSPSHRVIGGTQEGFN